MIVLLGLLVVWPMCALLLRAGDDGAASGELSRRALTATVPASPSVGEDAWIALLARSGAWALGAALAGTLLAWPASRAARRLRDHGRARWIANAAVAAILLPLVLPPWLLFAALWISFGPGTAIGDAAARGELAVELRTAVLVVALVVWSSAPAFAALMLAGPAGLADDARLLAIEGAGAWRRFRSALARDAAVLAFAIGATALFLFGETTAFDLALVPTYGFELRTLDSLGAAPSTILVRALPALVLCVAGVVTLPAFARLLGDARLRSRGKDGSGGGGGLASAVTVALSALPALVLLVVFVRALASTPRPGDFLSLHGEAAWTSLAVCGIAALAASLFALMLRIGGAGGSRGVRVLVRLSLPLALVATLFPGTVLALAFESAYNHEATAVVYDSPLIVAMALAARGLGIGAIVAAALAAREPMSAARLRSMDAATVLGSWRLVRREALVAAAATFPIALALGLGELCTSGRLVPPGMAWIATDVLNAIHYQRPETVLLATALLVVVALPGAFAVAALLRSARAARAILLVAGTSLCMLALPACGKRGPADDHAPSGVWASAPRVEKALPTGASVGRSGRGPGQFYGPRVIACDARDGSFFVIDKDARVQRFDSLGAPLAEWHMPRSDRGKPVGASVAPDGSLVVADTHEHRIVAYSSSGELLWTLGEYGLGAGQFIYPTDIAFAPDGRMFVSEYGSNDRIQVFDAARRHLYTFASFGVEPGQLLRPQSLAYDAARDELYVADSANHRIQVFTGDGEFRRAIGGPGRDAGRFSYPFGVVLEIGGVPVPSATELAATAPPDARRTIVVAENGNHRVQRLDAETGEVLGVFGGLGSSEGRIKYPWALEAAGGSRLAVCDHANNRIQFFELR